MTDRVDPNPFSPYADADPAYRHVFPHPLFAHTPTPGVLTVTGCDRLAVVPEPLTLGAGPLGPPDPLPEGMCPTCTARWRGHTQPADTRPTGPCRGCGSDTRHDGLCALCRQDMHATWWAKHRNEPTRTHLGWTLVHTTGPNTGENYDGPDGIPCQPTRADAENHLASLPAATAAGLAVARDTQLCHTYTCACGTELVTDYGQTHYASAAEAGEVADDLGWARRPDGGWDCLDCANRAVTRDGVMPVQLSARCDGPGCPANFDADFLFAETSTHTERIEALYRHLEIQGWKVDRAQNLTHCPGCNTTNTTEGDTPC